MKSTKSQYMGIQRLANAYTITIPAARKALMTHKVMDHKGQPVKPEYAKTSKMEDGIVWHQWEMQVADKAFKKEGYRLADSIELLGHSQNRHQANRKIYLCLSAIGDLVNLNEYQDTDNSEISKAVDVYLGASFHDCHAIGGPCAVLMIDSRESCAAFIKSLHFVGMDYVATCKKLANDEQLKHEIDRYYQSLKNLSDWVQLQYFR